MAEGTKKFVNQTGKNLNIYMFIREGGNPQDEGGVQLVSVAARGKVEAVYEGEPGPKGYVFLNGLLIEWADGTNQIGVSRRVVARGDDWDNALNTNDTVTIAALAAGTFDAYGSNTG